MKLQIKIFTSIPTQNNIIQYNLKINGSVLCVIRLEADNISLASTVNRVELF